MTGLVDVPDVKHEAMTRSDAASLFFLLRFYAGLRHFCDPGDGTHGFGDRGSSGIRRRLRPFRD